MNLIALILFMSNMDNNGYITEPAFREYQFIFPLPCLGTLTGRTIESSSSPSVGKMGEDGLASSIFLLSDDCALKQIILLGRNSALPPKSVNKC